MQSFEEILRETIESLKKSAEFNEIVGKPIVNGDGTLVLPVSKISVGFVAGGADYENEKKVNSITRDMIRILCALIILVASSTLLLVYIDFFIGLF